MFLCCLPLRKFAIAANDWSNRNIRNFESIRKKGRHQWGMFWRWSRVANSCLKGRRRGLEEVWRKSSGDIYGCGGRGLSYLAWKMRNWRVRQRQLIGCGHLLKAQRRGGEERRCQKVVFFFFHSDCGNDGLLPSISWRLLTPSSLTVPGRPGGQEDLCSLHHPFIVSVLRCHFISLLLIKGKVLDSVQI